MIPATVLPDDEQIVGPPDGWAFKLLLDTSKDWSTSTFTVDTPTTGLAVTLDQSHKADEAPYVLLSLTAEQLEAVGCYIPFHWNLAETPILNRTFATQRVMIVPR